MVPSKKSNFGRAAVEVSETYVDLLRFVSIASNQSEISSFERSLWEAASSRDPTVWTQSLLVPQPYGMDEETKEIFKTRYLIGEGSRSNLYSSIL
jgi:hypothetical protein